MSPHTRKFGYAALALGFLLSAAPAFADGGGGENPSSTTGSATSNRTLGAPPPAATTGTHSSATTRRVARRKTTTSAATPTSTRSQIPGEATGTSAQGTPNSQPALAPGAQQTNNPAGGAAR